VVFVVTTRRDVVMPRYGSVVLCVLLACSLRAAEPAGLPASPAPAFVAVAKVDKDKGTVNLQSRVTVPVTKYVMKQVERDGKKVTVAVPVTEYQQQTVEAVYFAKSFRLVEAGGKEIKGEDFWKRLTPGKLVLHQVGGDEPAPAYLKLLAKDALILAPAVKVEPKE